MESIALYNILTRNHYIIERPLSKFQFFSLASRAIYRVIHESNCEHGSARSYRIKQLIIQILNFIIYMYIYTCT